MYRSLYSLCCVLCISIFLRQRIRNWIILLQNYTASHFFKYSLHYSLNTIKAKIDMKKTSRDAAFHENGDSLNLELFSCDYYSLLSIEISNKSVSHFYN